MLGMNVGYKGLKLQEHLLFSLTHAMLSAMLQHRREVLTDRTVPLDFPVPRTISLTNF